MGGYLDLGCFIGVVLEDAVFNAAATRIKDSAVKTIVPYPAGAYVAWPF